MAAGDGLLGTGRFDGGGHGRTGIRDRYDLHVTMDDDTLALELIEDDGGAYGIVVRKRLRRSQNSHRTAQPAESLRQLQSDRTAADDDEVLRSLLDIENAL